MVSHVHHDVQPEPTVCRDSLVHGSVLDHYEWLEIGPFSVEDADEERVIPAEQALALLP